MDAQKKRLNKTDRDDSFQLPKPMFKVLGKTIFTILCSKNVFIETCEFTLCCHLVYGNSLLVLLVLYCSQLIEKISIAHKR